MTTRTFFEKTNIIFLGIISLGFFFAGYFLYSEYQGLMERKRIDFLSNARKGNLILKNRLENKKNLLKYVTSLYEASAHVDFNEFKIFTEQTATSNGLINVCWKNIKGGEFYYTNSSTSKACALVSLIEPTTIILDDEPKMIISDFVKSRETQKGHLSIIFYLKNFIEKKIESIYTNFLILNDKRKNKVMSFGLNNTKKISYNVEEELREAIDYQIYALGNFGDIDFNYITILKKEDIALVNFSKKVWSIFIFVILISFITAFYIRTILRQSSQTKELVKSKTIELINEIADRKEAQEKAEKYAEVKSNFLANMSHEIRTPMNGVLGMLDLIGETKLSAEQEDMISTVRTSGEHLMGMLNDILDFSKLETQNVFVNNSFFNLEAIISQTQKLLSPSARSKDIELSYKIAEKVPVQIKSDSQRIQQILLNLISNAIKFTSKGSVTLEIDVRENIENQYCLSFVVRDTGLGIAKDNLKKIFESFAQADETTSREFGGTGLGLAISLQLSKILGGNLEVVSELGEGSTFTFKTGLVLGKNTNEERSENEILEERKNIINVGGDSKKMRILVAEDNLINQKLIKRILEKLGHHTVLVINGEEALSQLEVQAFDLIFMDMQMPVLNGLDATVRIMKRFGAKAPPIIAMTANVSKEDKEKCYASGMCDFLGKPLSKKSVSEKICKYLK